MVGQITLLSFQPPSALVPSMSPSTLSSSTWSSTLSSTSAAATLDSLAQQFQQLPVASLAPAVILLLGGLLLLIAGRHFLRPVMVVTTVLLCAMLGPSVLGIWIPSAGGMVLALLGGLLGLVLAALGWRLVLGAATGVVAAFACAFLMMLVVDQGWLDARKPGSAIAPATASADAKTHDQIVGHTPELIHPLVEWADNRWRAEDPQVRTLLGAAAAGGGFVGVVFGAWMTESSAALLTSLVGAIFTLVGAMPFIAKVSDRAAQGAHPVGWLLLWIALSLAGWMFQTRKPGSRDAAAKHARETR